jgi:hypothetical protein
VESLPGLSYMNSCIAQSMNSAKYPFRPLNTSGYASEPAKNNVSQAKHRWPLARTAPTFVLSSIAIEDNKTLGVKSHAVTSPPHP